MSEDEPDRLSARILNIHLLGQFNLLVDGESINTLAAERPQTLLAYLLLHRHAPQSRQYLAFLLWPDSSESQARSNLRNLLYTLRQALPDADRFLEIEPMTLGWRAEAPFVLDVAQFEQAVDQAGQIEDPVKVQGFLETAVALYRGDLLPANYDDWLIPWREELRQRFLQALDKLIELMERSGDYRAAIHHTQRLLQQDPLNEVTYVRLMRLHALSGDRAGVRRTYQACVTTLARELGVEPGLALQDAFAELLRMEVSWPAESTEFAQPISAASAWRPRPLPVPATLFIGRETELAEIAGLLADPACRLVTIVGMGGMGKTRLALQTAVGHQQVFRDGVAYVPLTPLQSAESLVLVIGDALQFSFSASSDPLSQLIQFLSNREILLVLDNFEHLLERAETISTLLSAAPQVKVLVTSRQRLDLQGEWVYRIGGLPLPELNDTVALSGNSALALFRQSAQRADNRFEPSTADAAYAVQICRLVGGMPLAIELAASWARLLSCAEIAGEIERGLDFLAVSLRDIPERHRSIQTVIDNTWRLLTPREQQMLAQLSVFQGGFSREAAEQVIGATLPLLSALVDKSLVRRVEINRYDLHELIRQYAGERLVESGGFERANNRHFDFFLALAEESKTKLRSRELIHWLNLLDRDYGNLRGALEWSLQYHPESAGETPVEAYRGQKALRMTSALCLFWRIRAYWGSGRQWLQRALDLAPETPVTYELVEATRAAASLATDQMDAREAKQLAERALALARELGDPQPIALTKGTLGIVLWRQKEYALARSYCEEALAQLRQLNSRIGIADCLQVLGRIAMNQHDLERAQNYLEECLAIFKEIGEEIGFNVALSDLGLLAYLRQDCKAARLYNDRSLSLFREASDLSAIEMTLNRLGDVARCELDYEEAARYYRECLAIFRDSGDMDEIPSLLHNLGYIALHHGEHDEALDLFREGLGIHLNTGNRSGITECLAGIAAICTARGQVEEAARLFGTVEVERQQAAVVLWPANQMEYDRSLAKLRAAMDEAALSAAWREGRAMPTEEILRLAQTV